MITINDIKLNNKKIFARQTDEQIQSNLSILNYIETLASQTGKNISSWDIKTLFSDPSNKKQSLELIKDKNEINKIFFKQAESIKSPKAEIELISKRISVDLEKLNLVKDNVRIKSFESRIKDYESDIANYYNLINTHMLRIFELKTEIEKICRVNPNEMITNEISEVLLLGFYEYKDFKDGVLYLTTKNNIINTLINKIAGINLRVNLGKVEVRLDLKNMSVKVYPFEDNIMVDGIQFHPHVWQSREVCWGNAGTTIGKLKSTREIKKIFEILTVILTQYNPSSPVTSLATFDAVSKGKIDNEIDSYDPPEYDQYDEHDDDENENSF